MRFDLLHRLVTVAVVWIGLAALFLSGEFGPSVIIPAAAAPVVGVFFNKIRKIRHSGKVAGSVAAAAGVAAGYMAVSSTDYLYWAIAYAVFLAGMKSLYLTGWGDFMQMYALSFLSVMAAAVVNPGMSFGILMFPYVVALVFALMLNNLRQGMEQTAARAASTGETVDPAVFMARRGLIRRRFVATTVVITTAVFVAALVFFFLFPRLGLGFFGKQKRGALAMSGFSEQVNLGDFGNIIEDPGVVMRVVAPKTGANPYLRIPLRMKGQSLDWYDGRSWRKTTVRRDQMVAGAGGVLRSPDTTGNGGLEKAMYLDVYLEPMSGNPRVMFGQPMISGFRPPSGSLDALRPEKWRFYSDSAGDVTLTGPDATAIVYTVESVPPADDTDALRAAGAEYPDQVVEYYLKVPPQDPGVVEMAGAFRKEAVAAGKDNAYDIAVAVESRLQKDYRYSLNSSHGEKDPLADFLLRNKTGHCEYYASGMVVILRLLGIPARIVNGFYGGVRNEIGRYIAMRKSDAHSWVEVYFPGQGWVTFDPTPPGALALRQSEGLFQKVAQALDAARLAWYRWVIEYDLEKQVDFLARLLKVRKDGSPFGDSVNISDMKRIARKLKDLPWGLIFGLPVAAIAAAFGIRRLATGLRRPSGLPSGVPGVTHYRQVRRMLKAKGLVRAPSETQVEFASRAGRACPAAAADLEMIAWTYVRVLAGRDAGHSTEHMDEAVSRIRAALADAAENAVL